MRLPRGKRIKFGSTVLLDRSAGIAIPMKQVGQRDGPETPTRFQQPVPATALRREMT